MEVSAVVELINNVGFPIVVSGALFWLNVHTLKQQRLMLQELEKTINENTRVFSIFIEGRRKE